MKKKIIVTALLGPEKSNIEGFLKYHEPWVERFEFVHHNADEYSLDVSSAHSKSRLTYTDFSCQHQENEARNILQSKIDFETETALMLDMDERIDLRTLNQVTDEHFLNDLTIGIVNNCDNYFLIDGYPRQIFANKQLNYQHHTHSWAPSEGLSVFYLEFPKVNHLIQKPFKKAGCETDEDISLNPNKYLDKKLVKLFMDGDFNGVLENYDRFVSALKNRRMKFMCYMVYILACEQLQMRPKHPELPFFQNSPTKTEAAIFYIRQILENRTCSLELGSLPNNPFGVTSSFAQSIARKYGAVGLKDLHMWRP